MSVGQMTVFIAMSDKYYVDQMALRQMTVLWQCQTNAMLSKSLPVKGHNYRQISQTLCQLKVCFPNESIIACQPNIMLTK